ncbi:hypothetical protein [Mangrovicoccus sp. HB161399]|uniref:hypothetical protein n=1 Tax=Mangrovicoccus sp. HB161399 TaxID=2720392 RepID=UPI0015541C9C|nr:hypothetical protein [Mangrovicoccus sp. HB161399]
MTLDAFAIASAAGRVPEDQRRIFTRLGLSHALAGAVSARGPSELAHKVAGAGLCIAGGEIFSLVAVPEEDYPRVPRPDALDDLPFLADVPDVALALSELLGLPAGPFGHDAKVLALGRGERQAAPGDRVSAPGTGRLGPAVTWPGAIGFLTAGHVAPSAGAVAHDASGAVLGHVVWGNDPARSATGLADVDVALIDTGAAPAASAAAAQPAAGAAVTIAGSGLSGTVFGFCSFLRFGGTATVYADVYLTGSIISAAGDSGSLAADANGDVVGSLVGAYSGRNMSVIQSIGCQLAAIRTHGKVAASLL